MGPPDKRPAFPIYDVFELPGYKSVAGFQHFLPCNWLQTKENAMDPAHVLFLHTLPDNEGFAEDLAHNADFDYMESPIDLVHINTRRIRRCGMGLRL